jgi:UDP-N-acetylmuramoylalanine--D-glutamate ligase
MAPALDGKKVLVVGLGRSGVAAARLAAARGAAVTVTDRKPEGEVGEALAALPPGVAVEAGGHRRDSFLGADLIVTSPGVPEIAELRAAREAGVAVTGELELASRFVDAPIIAVTGTNGKSTTTALAGALVGTLGRPVFVGGNLGTPLAEAVGTPAAGAGGVCVVEVSSFQLETAETFRPAVGVLLNITPDHLDRHGSLAAYAAAKARLFAAQREEDFAVVNADDEIAEGAARGARSRRIAISTRRSLAGAAAASGAGWLEEDGLRLRMPGAGGAPERYPRELAGLVGRHNLENALAALAAARALGVDPNRAAQALAAFRPLPHRMELVGARGGGGGEVRFYDDSKGTNVGATVAALSGFPRPVVLIAGGKDKGGSYAPLADAMRSVGRAAVVIGEAAGKIREALAPVVPVEAAPTLEAAVARAAALAAPGDAVVLSPACSSFDMFLDYAHRAEVFRAAVLALDGVRPADGPGPVAGGAR